MLQLFAKSLKIENDRLLLSHVSEEDCSDLGDLFGEPLPKEKALFMIRALDANREAGKKAALAVRDRSSGTAAGVIEIWNKKDSIEIGYRIRPQFRHQNYAKDAVYLLVKYLMEATDIRKITADVRRGNEWSVRVLSHNGFELQGGSDEILHYAYFRRETDASRIFRPENGWKILWCAGGCFWGTEKVFRILDGVKETCVGYVNGNTEHPCYEDVSRGDTGYKEAVQIIYDPALITLETLMKAFFLCIDPTVQNRQGNDIGSQYQTGVYYLEEEDGEVLRRIFEEEKTKQGRFMTELEPVRNFQPAEEYHQRYLDKHPFGYCHITKIEMDAVRELNKKKVNA